MGSYYYIWLSKHAQEVSTFTQAYITQPLQLTSSTPLGLATGNRSQTAFSSAEVGLAASSKSSHSRGKWYVVFIDYYQEPVSSSSGRVLLHSQKSAANLSYKRSAQIVRKNTLILDVQPIQFSQSLHVNEYIDGRTTPNCSAILWP